MSYKIRNQIEMGNEETIKLSEQQARPFVNALKLKLKCRNIHCGTDLSKNIYGYPDLEKGDEVTGLAGRWWVFARCPNCGNECSLQKLFRERRARKETQ